LEKDLGAEIEKLGRELAALRDQLPEKNRVGVGWKNLLAFAALIAAVGVLLWGIAHLTGVRVEISWPYLESLPLY
jgi:fatty acid desaturase